jgi:hypothetical protein
MTMRGLNPIAATLRPGPLWSLMWLQRGTGLPAGVVPAAVPP